MFMPFSLKVIIESENSFLLLLLKKVPRAENKLPKKSIVRPVVANDIEY